MAPGGLAAVAGGHGEVDGPGGRRVYPRLPQEGAGGTLCCLGLPRRGGPCRAGAGGGGGGAAPGGGGGPAGRGTLLTFDLGV